MKIFKIRNRKTGLYSKGGVDAARSPHCWSKKGKIWNGLGALRNHLNQFIGTVAFNDWEVIEVEIVETETNVKPAAEMINPEKIIKILSK